MTNDRHYAFNCQCNECATSEKPSLDQLQAKINALRELLRQSRCDGSATYHARVNAEIDVVLNEETR
jgi:hypothetical protein